MGEHKHSIWTLTWLKNQPIRAQKVTNDPKIKWKSKVTIEENIENKSCSTTWEDPKTVFELYPEPKNSPLRLQKFKMTPKFSQIQKSELKES